MRNIRLTIAYDGTLFAGWQRQPAARTVQGVVEKALSELLRQPVTITGASRTDAGVHAYGQQASFKADFPIPTDRIKKALNGLLPADVRIVDTALAAPDFSARFSARGKTYEYRILNTPEPDVFSRNLALHVPGRLDAAAMAEAAAYFVGDHDFRPFSANGGDPEGSTVRTIRAFRVEERNDGGIILQVTGNAFLYKMVRMMTGSLIHIGLGGDPPDAVAGILSGERPRNGRTAQPQGLYLMKVYYDNEEGWRDPNDQRETAELSQEAGA